VSQPTAALTPVAAVRAADCDIVFIAAAHLGDTLTAEAGSAAAAAATGSTASPSGAAISSWLNFMRHFMRRSHQFKEANG